MGYRIESVEFRKGPAASRDGRDERPRHDGGGAMRVYVGGVSTWDTGLTPREQAVKVSEEVMEVFSAIEDATYYSHEDGFEEPRFSAALAAPVVDECCDVITAACNLLASIGVTDLRGAMERCAERQRERGRI